MKYFLPLVIALSIFINPVNAFAEELILAGGCFWCLEHDLESLKGINYVQSGYSGGDLQNPTYENHDGHQEVVLVNYDSKLVTLPEILRLYMRNIDPLDHWPIRISTITKLTLAVQRINISEIKPKYLG